MSKCIHNNVDQDIETGLYKIIVTVILFGAMCQFLVTKVIWQP